MKTNLTFNHTLYVYDVTADDFGDTLTQGDATQVPALVEDTQGWENDNFADTNTGNITAQIEPTNSFYIAKRGRLFGLVVQFSRFGTPDNHDWFRISSVRPGESLFDGSPDLVELTLTRISERESAE
jgi:hypothetical protein